MASKLIRKVISTSNAPKAAGPYRYSVNVFDGCFKMILRDCYINILQSSYRSGSYHIRGRATWIGPQGILSLLKHVP